MKKLTLKEPIKFGSETITELQFREPKAKDMRALPLKASTGDILDLAARLSGQLPSTLGELGIEDFSQVMEIVGGFFLGGQETSETL